MAATTSKVWRVLADFDGIVGWAPAVDHSCLLTEHAVGAGTVRRVQSGSVTLVERIVTWQPELVLAYAIEGLPPAIRHASNTWVLRPNGTGTSVSLITDIETVTTPQGRLIGRIVRRKLGEASATLLDALARTVESPRSPTATSVERPTKGAP